MCNCGWSFATQRVAFQGSAQPSSMPLTMPASQDAPPFDADELVRRERRSQASGQIAFGAILVAVGIIVTIVTYGSASQGGGTYIIAYGPIIFGVIRMVRGLASL